MERRKNTSSKSNPLPLDYLKMVNEVFTNYFGDEVKAFSKAHRNSSLDSSGAVYGDEIMLSVTLSSPGHITATTVHASVDFDPKASAPSAQDLLAVCVDAIASVWAELFKNLDALAQDSASSLEDGIPLLWEKNDVNNREVFLLVDKTNPALDTLADEWLAKHDPEAVQREKDDEEKVKKRFVTGVKKH